MLDSECVYGKKVICRDHKFHNRIGYIHTVQRATDGYVHSYSVKDSFGHMLGGGLWYSLNCFDLYQDDSMPNTLRSGSLPAAKKSIECPCGINRSACTYHK